MVASPEAVPTLSFWKFHWPLWYQRNQSANRRVPLIGTSDCDFALQWPHNLTQFEAE